MPDQHTVATGAKSQRKGREGTHVDRNTLTTESTASSNSVDVVLSVGGKVVAAEEKERKGISVAAQTLANTETASDEERT